MTKWFTFLLVGFLCLTFCGCGSTHKTTEQGDLDLKIKEMRDYQSTVVAELASDHYWNKWKSNIGDDFARHNWIEWPFAGILWGFSFISTGHQRKDFDKIHSDMDRYFFNAAWDDPYLVD